MNPTSFRRCARWLPSLLLAGLGAIAAATAIAGQAQPAASQPATPAQSGQRLPRIQLAILLDTSNSMDGLIDQTRNQLWQVINDFTGARQQGLTPVLEIALYEYGNDGLNPRHGYLRRLNGFTRELDRISESLFALTTNGGSEYCGYAILTALDDLQWSRVPGDLRAIFIAGNESFNQGPIGVRRAIERARQLGVSVNTIHAGDHREGIDAGWQRAALQAGGDYLAIDANRKVVHLDAPQDPRIAELNAELNATYLPFGASGAARAERQLEQDAQSDGISSGLLAKRALSKASSFYRNSSWDLVDALQDGALAEAEIVDMEAAELPAPMQAMDAAQRLEYVREQAGKREAIQRELAELGRQRDAWLASRQKAAEPDVSDALTSALRDQASRKNFVFVE